MTSHYLRIIEELSDIHMQLTGSFYNYLSNFVYKYYMIVDLNYAYLLILIHSEHQKFFTFTILGIHQFQLVQI